MTHVDFDMRGYGVLSLHPDRAACEHKAPGTVLEKGSPVNRLAAFVVPNGSKTPERIA